MAIVVDGRTDQAKLQELLQSPEQTELEFKEALDLSIQRDELNFVKDVVAMSNRPPGGYIIVGVGDDGTPKARIGTLNRDQFDGAKLGDKVRKYIEGQIRLIDALERVEVAVRAALTDHMAMTYNDAHWYLDASHFHNRGTHKGLLKIVRELCDNRLHGAPERPSGRLVHPSALEHYLMTYGTPDLPPSWVMVEMITIGSLRTTYDNLQRRSDRMAIARALGLNEPILASWLKTYVRVRNICAHHGRLWNVGLCVYPRLPTGSAVSWLEGDRSMLASSTKRLYLVLVSLQSILDTVSPRSGWARRLEALVSTRPAMNVRGMGFPAGWAEDPFWKRHLTQSGTTQR